MSRAELRARLEAVLREEAGVLSVHRSCHRCAGSDHGRPVARVEDGATAPWVSLSYAGSLAVVAWSHGGPVGVDVERDGPPVDGVGDRTVWTRTEALLKATGRGLDGLADPLPDLPTATLELPPGWVGTLAGYDAQWRVVRERAGPAAPGRAASR